MEAKNNVSLNSLTMEAQINVILNPLTMEAQNNVSLNDQMMKALKKENNRMIKAQKKEKKRMMKAQKQERKTIFISHPPTPSPQPHPWPWLLVTHGDKANGHHFYSILEKRCYIRSIPNLRNKVIRHLSHGWLILDDWVSKQLSLLNMVSLQVIQLPERCFDFLTCSILLFPPTDPNCRVVFFTQSEEDSSIVFFCKPGDSFFHQHHIGTVSAVVDAATTFQGKIYCVTPMNFELLVLDLCDISRPQVTTLINKTSFDFDLIVPPYALCYRYEYLFEFCDELFVVVQAFKGSHTQSIDSFSIFRADLSENMMTWVKVRSIGENCAIFIGAVGRGMCSLASPEHGVKGNTVYFMNILDRCLYSYDLLEQSYSIYPPCPNVKRTKSEFCWIPMDYISTS